MFNKIQINNTIDKTFLALGTINNVKIFNCENNNIIEDKTSIKMGNLTPAIYFIKVLQNNEEIKIFKVIKK